MPRAAKAKPVSAAIGESELAAVSPTLFAHPALWRDLALPVDAASRANAAPWSAYWSVRLGPLADFETARATLAAACAAFEARGERLGAALASAAALDFFAPPLPPPPALETYYFDEVELALMDPWIERLDAALEGPAPPWPNAECGAEIMACTSALLLRQPTHPRLAQWVADAPRALPKMALVPSRVKYAAAVAHFHLWRGEFGPAAVMFDSLPGVDLTQLRPKEALIWLEGVAAFCRFTAQIDRGRDAVREALALVDANGMASERYGVHSLGVALELAAQDAKAARTHLEAMRGPLDERSQSEQTAYWVFSSGLALLQGQTKNALALARSTWHQAVAAGGPYRSVSVRLTLASALLAAGEVAPAIEQARETCVAAREIDATLTEFSAALVLSQALDRDGQREAADRALADALALGAQHDYAITGGWWQPAAVAERLARALQVGIEPAYAARWAQRARLPCPDRALAAWPWPLRVHGFGRLRVLRDGVEVGGLPQRPLDLLRALLAHGGHALPVATALDWLWPDADHEQQRKAFDAALLRLRRALGDERLFVLDGGQLLADRTRVFTDVAALADGHWQPPPDADAAQLVVLGERLLQLAAGPLLDGMTAPWALTARESGRRRFVTMVGAIAQALEACDAAQAWGGCGGGVGGPPPV
jgi:LuxR family transcriptional regulator, maltose regulon positive regulatory protein